MFSVKKSRSHSSFRLTIGNPTSVWPASAMPSRDLGGTRRDEYTLEHHRDTETDPDPDAEFGGTEARKNLEKGLLLKLDARMSILIVIYILNYVSRMQIGLDDARILTPCRSIGTM